MTATQQSPGEWRRGWALVLSTTLAMSVGSLHIHTLGAAMQPLQGEFGWTRAEIAGSLSITAAMCVLFAAGVGGAADRHGSRWIGIVGVIWMCLAMAGLSLAGPSIASWWVLWFLVSCGVVLTCPMIWAAAIAGAFNRGRGMAIAVMLCGTGVTAALVPYLTTVLIADYGWRSAYVIVAAVWGAVTLPMLLLFFFDRRSAGAQKGASASSPRSPLWRDPALRSPTFLKLGLVTLILTTGLLGCSVHLLPILTDGGLSRETAAAIISLMGPAAIAGRLTTGFVLDHTRNPLIGSAIVSTLIVSCLILLFAPLSPATAAAAAIGVGLSLGAELDVVTYLTSRYFGLRQFGRLNGVIVGLLGIGTGLGPFLAGRIFDTTGSYDIWLAIMIPACLAAWALLGSLGRYPDAGYPPPGK